MGCSMYLKYFPADADVGALIQLSMDMTQTALLRVYEIVEIEKRPLTEDEHRALNTMLTHFGLASDDVMKLTMRMAN